MNPDLFMAIGILLGVFSIPAVLSALSEGRAPRVAAFTIVTAGLMVLWAVTQRPGGYTLREIPDVFVRVVAEYLT
ncbi:MAG: hypothetical protein AAGA28_18390 [Pseudomonadota bacterium]